jgi:hypothetical protein
MAKYVTPTSVKTFTISVPTDIATMMGGQLRKELYFDLSYDQTEDKYHLVSSKYLLFHETFVASDEAGAILSARQRVIAAAKDILEVLL